MAIKRETPLGIMPRKAWLEQRVRELSRAITRQADTPGHAPDWNLVTQWADEMQGILCELDNLKASPAFMFPGSQHTGSLNMGNCLDGDIEAGMEESGQ